MNNSVKNYGLHESGIQIINTDHRSRNYSRFGATKELKLHLIADI